MNKAADQGDLDAEFTLGYNYFTGEMLEINNDKAFEFFTRAANKGHIQAKVYLGRCYASGYGTVQDFQKAFQCYQAAAETNDIYGLFMVGQYLIDGRAGKLDHESATHYFERAAALGDMDSQARLAQLHIYGKGGTVNVAKGLAMLQAPLQQKNATALYTMAILYETGLGVPQDLVKCRSYFQQAAEFGTADAQFEYSKFLMKKGLESKADFNEGLLWLEKAANREHEQAKIIFNVYKNRHTFFQPNAVPKTNVKTPNKDKSSERMPKPTSSQVAHDEIASSNTSSFAGLKKGFLG